MTDIEMTNTEMTGTALPHNATEVFALTRPIHVGQAHLVVSDLATVSAFYREIIGLGVLEQSASGMVLGVGAKPLLTLTTRGDVARAPRTAAGLFHTAFLLPSRKALAGWLRHAAHAGVRLDGASDHLVSEAIYLSDPEGNGIEIYRDRAPLEWTYHADGTVEMATLSLDLQKLYDSATDEQWTGLPEGSSIGHMHLQVGNVPEADRFYEGVLGLKKMATYPGASFFGSGQYHHHIAANIWNSRGAGPRQAAMTGLADYALRFNDIKALDTALKTLERLEIPVTRSAEGHRLTDPWGIGLTLSAAE
ncbi:catechol 2,3-dioxygenase [Rhizobium taibaishanense]|uniref:Catechol 2,3-dioxygenase n=2 Tax=Allorhizobium taibaishanense TaxID=887144 RepID=A0A7W6HLE3_9HYPH|nr:catechol 2,3-dioxygenase [Allorhizobium taibaishanense]